MGILIHFPTSMTSPELSARVSSAAAQPAELKSTREEYPSGKKALVFTSGEDHAFLELIREWPCFQGTPPDLSLEELLQSYYDDELDLAQDCVIEFMFHMQDGSSPFDIGNALFTWDEDDRAFFMLSLNVHAELIDQVKKEEED